MVKCSRATTYTGEEGGATRVAKMKSELAKRNQGSDHGLVHGGWDALPLMRQSLRDDSTTA